jgi:general secretion pathway protein K
MKNAKRQPALHPAHGARGAALLLAMIVLTLVATMASAMVWQQSRAVQIEAAERARSQAGWMLSSGIDFAREIVRRNATADPRREQPWDQPLAETRLSSLLAADRDNNADSGIEAFISGRVEDAQSRYNLRNLFDGQGKPVEAEVKTLQRLCEAIGLPGTAEAIISALSQAWVAARSDDSSTAVIEPSRIEDLAWAGIDATTLATLAQVADILPGPTPINLNTAQREVIYAVIPDIDLGRAERIVRQRNNRFANLQQLIDEGLLPASVQLAETRASVRSTHFYVTATVRYEDRALTERALVRQNDQGAAATVVLLRRERRPSAVRAS